MEERCPVTPCGVDCFSAKAEELAEMLRQYGPIFSCDCGDENLETEYLTESLGVRMRRERAFRPKLLRD